MERGREKGDIQRHSHYLDVLYYIDHCVISLQSITRTAYIASLGKERTSIDLSLFRYNAYIILVKERER